jgi:hypothetical protein
VVAIFDLMAQSLGLFRCAPARAPASPHTTPAAETQRLAALTVDMAPASETGKAHANGARLAARRLLDSAHEVGEEEVSHGKVVS